MGSFSSTCAVSGLPIEAGDDVRWLLLTENPYCDGGFVCDTHGRWVPRTWPIKARYNDYGSIEGWDEDSPYVKAVLAGLERDLVEIGVGDNKAHDVAARKGMTFPELLTAVWEGRVRVERDNGRGLRERLATDPAWPYSYVPTLGNVEKALASVDLPEKCSFLVDERPGNYTRVRWDSGYQEGYWGKDVEWLEKAQAALEAAGFATALVAGSGKYSVAVDLRVFVAPGKTEQGHGRRAEWQTADGAPLLVQQAMIREDVWQALVGQVIRGWDKETRVDSYVGGARAFVKGLLETAEKNAKLQEKYAETDPELVESLMDRLEMTMYGNRDPGCALAAKELIPFTTGLSTHAQILIKSGVDAEEFGDLMGEFTFLFSYLLGVRYVWRPSDTTGPQYGGWGAQVEFHKAVLSIAEVKAEEERRMMEDDYEEEG